MTEFAENASERVDALFDRVSLDARHSHPATPSGQVLLMCMIMMDPTLVQLVYLSFVHPVQMVRSTARPLDAKYWPLGCGPELRVEVRPTEQLPK